MDISALVQSCGTIKLALFYHFNFDGSLRQNCLADMIGGNCGTDLRMRLGIGSGHAMVTHRVTRRNLEVAELQWLQ